MVIALSIGLAAMVAVGAPDVSTVSVPQQTAATELPDTRSAISDRRTSEVDLGTFRISVPLSEDHAILIVDFQLYGTVAVYKEDELSSRLADRTLRLRHAVVMTVRETSLKELADPRLTLLLQRIRQAANSVLDGPEIIRVGFHQLDYVAE